MMANIYEDPDAVVLNDLDSHGRKLQEVLEFWLISAPGAQQTFDGLNGVIAKQSNLGSVFKFHIPDLKVGTLDTLVGLAEDLGKLDQFVESIARKCAQYLGDVLEDEKDKLKENLIVNGGNLSQAVTRFQWDMAKYPIKQSLKNISDIIAKQMTQIDTDLKAKVQAYNALKGSLQNLERKATGSLLTRGLAEIVKKDDFIQDSEYLVTVVVVISSGSQKEWFAKYERLSDMVVPRSSKVVFEDNEYVLVTATVFQKVVDEFKHHCRENKFMVRDFQYNENEVEAGKNEIIRLVSDKKKQFGPLVRWLKVNFAESFIAWLHLKAIRIFVESVLRYGLPVNFQAMVLSPPRKSQKRLRDVLSHHYRHLDASGDSKSKEELVEVPGINMSMADYFPYVFLKIAVDMGEPTKA